MTDTFLFWLLVVKLDVENATLNMYEIFTTRNVITEVE